MGTSIMPAASNCSGMADCGSCLSKQDSFRYLCFWCPSDAEGNRCHDDGSVETGCTTATCISKSSLSTCDKGSCPSVAQNAKTALTSPVQTSPSTESKPFTSIMPAASNCSGITDCGSCLSKQDSFRYLCFWCPSDAEGNRCHDDGSVETGCTTATCISKSSLSTCD